MNQTLTYGTLVCCRSIFVALIFFQPNTGVRIRKIYLETSKDLKGILGKKIYQKLKLLIDIRDIPFNLCRHYEIVGVTPVLDFHKIEYIISNHN